MRITICLTVAALIALQGSMAQIGTKIPSNRRVDWRFAGYAGTAEIPETYTDTIIVGSNVASSIAAAKDSAKAPGSLVLVSFPSGSHTIDQYIQLDSNIVLKGAGSTYPNYPSKLIYTGSGGEDFRFIRVYGSLDTLDNHVAGWSSQTKIMTLNAADTSLSAGDYVQIIVPDSSWHDTANDSVKCLCYSHENVVGQIVKIESVNGSQITLKDDIGLTLSLNQPAFSSNQVGILRLNPAKRVGIENLEIKAGVPLTGTTSSYGWAIVFQSAVDCWVRNIYSRKPWRVHVEINKSSGIEVRGSTFNDALDHGGGGHGYGISVNQHSTNCLIEDNIFRRLRHAMLVAYGANRNVFGYNYSREQHDQLPNYDLGDISIHGHYPYANLFEGNRIDRIFPDMYWGKNGPFNTFFRNYSYYGEMIFEWTLVVSCGDSNCTPVCTSLDCISSYQGENRYNIFGNEGSIVHRPAGYGVPSAALDHYGTSVGSSCTQSLEPSCVRSHTEWTSELREEAFLRDTSYYQVSQPTFITGVTWPPLGPPTDINFQNQTSQNIPARIRWCTANPGTCDETDRISPDEAEVSIGVPSLGQNHPNPFNPTAIVGYFVPKAGRVNIKLYNVLGQEVMTVLDDFVEAGNHSVEIQGRHLSAGVYFYRMTTDQMALTNKMMLLK